MITIILDKLRRKFCSPKWSEETYYDFGSIISLLG